ncbi:MAG: hypothetical protein AAGG75_13995 [Bacteroidota bacterium]
MSTNSVAFETTEGPEIATGAEVGKDKDCYVFLWVVAFMITSGKGQNLPINKKADGHVVQRVDVRKTVTKCDGTKDKERSETKTLLETFQVKNGESVNADTIQLGFLKDRITNIVVTLSASFHTNLQDKDFSKKFKDFENPAGADGLLHKEPEGFQPTLMRTISFQVNCCNGADAYKFDIKAHNSWGTYEEHWSPSESGEKMENKKTVDGKEVKPEKEEEE